MREAGNVYGRNKVHKHERGKTCCRKGKIQLLTASAGKNSETDRLNVLTTVGLPFFVERVDTTLKGQRQEVRTGFPEIQKCATYACTSMTRINVKTEKLSGCIMQPANRISPKNVFL